MCILFRTPYLEPSCGDQGSAFNVQVKHCLPLGKEANIDLQTMQYILYQLSLCDEFDANLV